MGGPKRLKDERRKDTDPMNKEEQRQADLDEMEAEMIRRTLEHTGGNRTHAAELLGIGVRTLQRKMRSFGIDIAPTKRRSRRPKRVNES